MLVSEKIELEVGYIEFHQAVDFADIHHIEISPEFHNQGYGTQLLNTFLNDMKHRGVKDVTLEVRVDNYNAIHLYEKFGFKVVGNRKGYYQGIDGLLMKLELLNTEN